jgi:hypothetical protein
VLVALGWIGYAAVAIFAVLALAKVEWHLSGVLGTGLFLVGVPGVGGVLLGQRLRCTACRGRIIGENLEPKHPSADRLPFLMLWSTAIVRVLLAQPLVCMHCGETYATRS